MAFILSENRANHDQCARGFAAYREYLERWKATFPPNAYALASSKWYFEPSEHRCPHDAWLESVMIAEAGTGGRAEVRHTTVQVRLLAAYHDGFIQLFYSRVFGYSFQRPSCLRGVGDWRFDEFRLSDNGHLIHEIEWSGAPGEKSTRWVIEALDVEYKWLSA